ncbi:acyl carrier protein [Streptomyces mirabilis]|uniref:acyl carrier protein n=1 Tax=Streptomyces mirabilis TaxID=68239 RepID=UPI0031BBC0F7
MREMNEDASVYAGQRAAAEAIERGGGGLSVDALLAKVRTAAAPTPTGPAAGVAAGAVPDVVRDVEGPAAAVRDVEGPAAAVPDVAALAAAIAAVAGRHLPEGHLSPDVDFFDAGGTSVGAVELVAALEDELGMEIALDDVFADARPTSLAHRRLPTAGATAALSAPAAPKTPTPGVIRAPDTAGTARSEGTSGSVTVGSPPPSSAAGNRPAPAPGILPVPGPRTAPAVAVPAVAAPPPRTPRPGPRTSTGSWPT